jgi:hypothetical protein
METIYRKTKGETSKCPICEQVNNLELKNPCPHIINVYETHGRTQLGWGEYYQWTYTNGK